MIILKMRYLISSRKSRVMAKTLYISMSSLYFPSYPTLSNIHSILMKDSEDEHTIDLYVLLCRLCLTFAKFCVKDILSVLLCY